MQIYKLAVILNAKVSPDLSWRVGFFLISEIILTWHFICNCFLGILGWYENFIIQMEILRKYVLNLSLNFGPGMEENSSIFKIYKAKRLPNCVSNTKG